MREVPWEAELGCNPPLWEKDRSLVPVSFLPATQHEFSGSTSDKFVLKMLYLNYVNFHFCVDPLIYFYLVIW